MIDSIFLILKSKNKKVIGKIFNVGSGKSITIKNLVNKIQKKIQKGKAVFGKKKFKDSEIIRSKASITKIKKIINWSPKVSLDKGIDNLISMKNKLIIITNESIYLMRIKNIFVTI